MATYVNDLRLKEIATGDESGTWGTSTNTNLELIAEAFSFGTEAITTNADTHTTTIADGSTDPGRSIYLKYTGTLDSACTITIGPNTVSKLWFIENGTSGSQNIIISQGSGASITIPPGDTKAIYSDGAGSGAAMVDAFASLSVVDLKVQDDLTVTDDMTVGGTLGVTGVLTATSLDISGDIDVDGTTNLDVVDIDGAVDMASTLQVDGAITGSSTIVGSTINGVGISSNITNFANSILISNDAGTGTLDAATKNTGLGWEVFDDITTADGNTGLGYQALTKLTTAPFNTALGRSSLAITTTGDGRNTAVGYQSLTALTTGNNNVGVGMNAGAAITTGIQNVLIGSLAGDALTDADFNVVLGTSALSADTLGNKSTAIGHGALNVQNFTSATDTYNTAVGYTAGAAITTGKQKHPHR